MAGVREMFVRIVGDSRSVERAFDRSSKAAKEFNRNVETTGKKVDRQAKTLSAFGKGAAVGFGGAFALTETINVVRNLASVAAESEQVLGQTRVALEATGQSWERYGSEIETAIRAQSRLGFDDEALLRTFSLFVRNTNDVGKALRLNNLAMDVARARFIDLEQAAQLVNKAAIGNAGALRRLGINARTGATSVELLTLLTEKYGGSAEAASDDSATAFARAQVATENLQEALGTLLLPALERGAGAMTELAEFTTNATEALNKLAGVRIPEIEIPFNITIGGQSVGDVGGGLLGKLKFTPLNPLFGVAVANAIADQFRDQAEKATPNLSAALQASTEKMIQDAMSSATFGITPLPSTTAATVDPSVAATAREIIAQAQGDLQEVLAIQTRRRDSLRRQVEAARQTWKDAEKLGALEKRYAQAQADVIGTQKTIRSNAESAREAAQAQEKAERDAARAKTAADKAAAKRRLADARARAAATREALRAREQARQFRAIGLGAEGQDVPPTIRNLRRQLTQLSQRDDLSRNQRGLLARIRKVLVDPIRKATPETRDAINNLFKTIRDTFRDNDLSEGPLTKTTSLNANRILAGLGLTPDAERELRSRLSNFNSAGIGLAGARQPTGNFRGGIPVVVENHNTVNLDGDTVARNVTRSQQKTRRRNPVQKRGSRRGGV